MRINYLPYKEGKNLEVDKMRFIEWWAETCMIPFWLAGEWLEELSEQPWFRRWQTAEREAGLFLPLTFPGWWS